MQLQGLVGYILLILWIAVLATTVYAFVHAAMQRPDAYPAADKLTKPVWLVILGVAGLLALVFGPGSVLGPAIAAVAAGVYLVDVRPKLLEVQGSAQRRRGRHRINMGGGGHPRARDAGIGQSGATRPTVRRPHRVGEVG